MAEVPNAQRIHRVLRRWTLRHPRPTDWELAELAQEIAGALPQPRPTEVRRGVRKSRRGGASASDAP